MLPALNTKELIVVLPENDINLTKEQVVQMLYLAAGWTGRQSPTSAHRIESALDNIALTIHDTF